MGAACCPGLFFPSTEDGASRDTNIAIKEVRNCHNCKVIQPVNEYKLTAGVYTVPDWFGIEVVVTKDYQRLTVVQASNVSIRFLLRQRGTFGHHYCIHVPILLPHECGWACTGSLNTIRGTAVYPKHASNTRIPVCAQIYINPRYRVERLLLL